MIYIAHPYTAHAPYAIELQYVRYKIAQIYVSHLLSSGVNGVYSPIVHCHPLAEEFNLPKTSEFWGKENKAMIGKAREIHVLLLDAWQASVGLRHEMDLAGEYKIPTCYFTEKSIAKVVPNLQEVMALWLHRHKKLVTL